MLLKYMTKRSHTSSCLDHKSQSTRNQLLTKELQARQVFDQISDKSHKHWKGLLKFEMIQDIVQGEILMEFPEPTLPLNGELKSKKLKGFCCYFRLEASSDRCFLLLLIIWHKYILLVRDFVAFNRTPVRSIHGNFLPKQQYQRFIYQMQFLSLRRKIYMYQ